MCVNWIAYTFCVLLHVTNTVIEEANWLTVYDDIRDVVGDGFDAVICLGNSFAHMLDASGEQRDQKRAIKNFEECVKPGGLLLIDHRNYDNIMSTGNTPAKSLYYNVSEAFCVYIVCFKLNIVLMNRAPRRPTSKRPCCT